MLYPFTIELFTLRVRGRDICTDTHDNCMTQLMLRYGWVPMQHNHLLRIEMVPHGEIVGVL